MANFTFSNGTSTIGATEFSIAQNANYSAGSPKTTQGYVQAVIDFIANLAAGDQYQVRIYEKANGGTQRPLLTAVVTGAQSESYVTPLLLLGEGWDITVKKLAGTDRSILFSVRQDTNDVNAATIGTDAVNAAALATSAATEIAAAVWTAVSEGTEVFGDTIRLIASRLFGKGTVQDGDGTYSFRDKGDTKNRLVMARSGSARTVSTRDGT